MAVISKWAFKRLVDELSSEQYEQMVRVLGQSDVSFPGWRDRLVSDLEGVLPAEAVRFQMPLPGWSRALGLARTATCADSVGDPKGGVWLQASHRAVRVSGSDNYAAAVMDLEATVDVPGTVVADARDVWQITEALRKGLPQSACRAAMMRVETEGDSHVRLTIDSRSHRARLLRRPTSDPELPSTPAELVTADNAAMLRRAIFHTVAAADWSARRGSEQSDFYCVGLRVTDGTLTLDATDRFGAAQASLPVDQGASLALLVDYLWLREVAAAWDTGGAWIGRIALGNGDVLMFAGKNWTAWTTSVLPWQKRFEPTADDMLTAVTFLRDDAHRYLVEAKRLAESGWGGSNSWRVKGTIRSDSLQLSSIDDGEGAQTGVLRIPAESDAAEPVSVYLHVGRMIDALQGFAKQDVTLHAGAGRVAYVTTARYRPNEHPPALWAMPTSIPEDQAHEGGAR